MIIFNASDFIAKTNAITAKVDRSLGLIGQEAGQLITTITEPRTPVEKGALRSSGTVIAGSGAPGYVQVIIEYSATNPRTGYNYAMIQHENDAYSHPRGGEAHYLLNTIMQESGAIVSLMASQLAVAIG